MVQTLVQRSPCWGLPSCDVASIRAQAYLKLAGVDFRLEASPNRPDAAELPYLEFEDGEVAMNNEPGGIEAFLREKKRIDLNSGLPKGDQGDLGAFLALVESRLADASDFTFWVETANTKMTRPAYAGGVPWPISHVLWWIRQRDIAARLGVNLTKIDERRGEIYQRSKEAYEALSTKLGNHEYMLGSRPSSLDAALFAHLIFHLRAPLVENTLKEQILSHGNLVEYAERLQREVFGLEEFSATYPTEPLHAPAAVAGRGSGAGPSRTAGGEQQGAATEAKSQKKQKKQRSEKEAKFRRRAKYFVIGQIASMLTFLLFSSVEVEEEEMDHNDDDEMDD